MNWKFIVIVFLLFGHHISLFNPDFGCIEKFGQDYSSTAILGFFFCGSPVRGIKWKYPEFVSVTLEDRNQEVEDDAKVIETLPIQPNELEEIDSSLLIQSY